MGGWQNITIANIIKVDIRILYYRMVRNSQIDLAFRFSDRGFFPNPNADTKILIGVDVGTLELKFRVNYFNRSD